MRRASGDVWLALGTLVGSAARRIGRFVVEMPVHDFGTVEQGTPVSTSSRSGTSRRQPVPHRPRGAVVRLHGCRVGGGDPPEGRPDGRDGDPRHEGASRADHQDRHRPAHVRPRSRHTCSSALRGIVQTDLHGRARPRSTSAACSAREPVPPRAGGQPRPARRTAVHRQRRSRPTSPALGPIVAPGDKPGAAEGGRRAHG